MKLIFTILAVIVIGSCFAFSESACVFLGLEPSSINRALGYGNIGVVDIWHNNPLISYSNPAIASLHEGISYGYTHENWLKGSGYSNMYYDCGLINVGYNGIGIILPAPNKGEEYGINLDYGIYEHYDEDGNSYESHSIESAAVYGLAINASEIMRKDELHSPVFDNLDLAFGAEYVGIKSYLPWYVVETDYKTAKAHCFNIGAIAAYNTVYSDLYKLEGVCGIAFFNAADEKIKNEDNSKDTIYRNANLGCAVSFSIVPDALLKDKVNPELIFFNNFVSFRLLGSVQDDYSGSDNPYGFGAELGFLDTVFIRKGYYKDSAGQIEGYTRGFGFDLHYKDIISYSYNTSSIPGGDMVHSDLKSHDHAFMVNFMGMYELIKK